MKIIASIILISLVVITGCSSSEKKAAELLDTARFEEKQTNREHAIKLYNDIVITYPASRAAQSATTRLEELKRSKL